MLEDRVTLLIGFEQGKLSDLLKYLLVPTFQRRDWWDFDIPHRKTANAVPRLEESLSDVGMGVHWTAIL